MGTRNVCGDVFIYICHNCIPQGSGLEKQWLQNGFHVQVRMLPCSGKLSTQYLFHAFEGGSHSVCVIACPKGECSLVQGNYRAEIRVQNVKRLLAEIGLESERIRLLNFSKEDSFENLKRLIHDTVDDLSKLKENPVFSMSR